MPSASPINLRNSHIKTQTRLQLKKAQQAERDIRLQRVLASVKSTERSNDDGNTKRRSNDFLARYIAPSIYGAHVVRPESLYRARSYNRARQVLSLIDHLFVKYPVPLFLYRAVLSYEGMELIFDGPPNRSNRGKEPPESKYREWFLAVAQGKSFAKVSKDVFTKREAHCFLQAPTCNGIAQNIFWARAAAAGVPVAGCDHLVKRFEPEMIKRIGERLPDFLRFFAEAWNEMRGYDRDEITDFIRAAVQNPEFSFKGRTYGSMRKLCHEWHRTVYVGTVREYRSWLPRLQFWQSRKNAILVRAEELVSNRALADEGQRQGHCVFTYTSHCIEGRSCIVSLRWFAVSSISDSGTKEVDRLTIEVSPARREVVQIRGPRNRRATNAQMDIVRIWAGDRGLTIGPYA